MNAGERCMSKSIRTGGRITLADGQTMKPETPAMIKGATVGRQPTRWSSNSKTRVKKMTTKAPKSPKTKTQDQADQLADLQTSSDADLPLNDDGDTSHLEGFIIPEIEHDDNDQDAPIRLDENGEEIAPVPIQLDQDAFYVVFCTAFDAPGMLMAKFKPMGIQPDERQTSRAASDAVYRLLEIYYPAALMPQSETLAHLMVAAPFVIGKVMIVREIFRADRARPVEEATPDTQPKPKEEPKFSSTRPTADRPMSEWNIEGEE